MDKVYLVYEIIDDLEEQETYSYLREICSSLENAQKACQHLDHFEIEEWAVT